MHFVVIEYCGAAHLSVDILKIQCFDLQILGHRQNDSSFVTEP